MSVFPDHLTSDFTIALIGRPNVGKSTLFNRLIGRKLALVHDQPGVTRDRREGRGSIADLDFRLLDTPGLEDSPSGSLEHRMCQQTEQAIKDAHLVCFIIDGRAGLMPDDRWFADWLRRQNKPIILLANKCEGGQGDDGFLAAFSLGFGTPLKISGAHGDGMTDLYDAITDHISQHPLEGGGAFISCQSDLAPADQHDDIQAHTPLKVAIIGRPNAGKSTLINTMIGDNRLLTGPEAGLTRDSIQVNWTWQGRPVILIDTAGMRKKARIDEDLENMAVHDGLRAVRYAEIVILLTDATAPLEGQDMRLAAHVVREGRGLVIGINKWDQVRTPRKTLTTIRDRLERSLYQVRGVPVICLSALEHQGISQLMTAAVRIWTLWNTRVSTARLNTWLDSILRRHPPPLSGQRRLKIRYITQARIRPPTFALFMNRPTDIPDSYVRFLTNALRQDFNLDGVVLRVVARGGSNPYMTGKGNRKKS